MLLFRVRKAIFKGLLFAKKTHHVVSLVLSIISTIREETHQDNENVLLSNCVAQYRIPKPRA